MQNVEEGPAGRPYGMLTTYSDFAIYRRNGHQVVPLLTPPDRSPRPTWWAWRCITRSPTTSGDTGLGRQTSYSTADPGCGTPSAFSSTMTSTFSALEDRGERLRQEAVHVVGHPPGAAAWISCAERIEILGPAAFSEDGLSLLTPAKVHCPDASLDPVNDLCGLTQDEIGREFGGDGGCGEPGAAAS